MDCGYRIALSVSFFMDEISKSESGRMICYEEVQRANMDPSELITLCMYCYSRQIYMTKEA